MTEIKKGSIWYRHGFKGTAPIPFKVVRLGIDDCIDMKGHNKPFIVLLNCESNQYQTILLRYFKRKFTPEQKLTTGEAFMYEGQRGRLGGFHTKLYDCISHADSGNLKLLAKGFPREVAIFNDWSWDDIVDKVEGGAEPRYSPWYNRD